MHLTHLQKLYAVFIVSSVFFFVEIGVGVYSHSMALIADAFHYLNDVIGYYVSIACEKKQRLSKKDYDPYTYRWARAGIVSAFYNSTFLQAVALSIFLSSIQRFAAIEKVEDPVLVGFVGFAGLVLNIINHKIIGHEHHGHSLDEEAGHGLNDHKHKQKRKHATSEDSAASESHFVYTNDDATITSHSQASAVTDTTPLLPYIRTTSEPPSTWVHRSLNMLAVSNHILGDAVSNIGVIIAAVVMWISTSKYRFYVDPAMGLLIAFVVAYLSVEPLRHSLPILLQRAPEYVNIETIINDLTKNKKKFPGVSDIHELHIWTISEGTHIASAHVRTPYTTVLESEDLIKGINDYFHALDIHSTTLQMESVPPADENPSPWEIVLGNGTGRDKVINPLLSGGYAKDEISSGVRQRLVGAGPCHMGCGDKCKSTQDYS